MKGRRIIFDTRVQSSSNEASYWLRQGVEALRARNANVSASVLGRIADRMDEAESYVEPEPTGVGAVVEASCVHSDERRVWLRDWSGNWHPEASMTAEQFEEQELADDYASLVDPVVLSPGWSK